MAIMLTDYIKLALYVNKEARITVGSKVHVKGSSLLLSRITVQVESNFKITQRSNMGIANSKGSRLLVFRYIFCIM